MVPSLVVGRAQPLARVVMTAWPERDLPLVCARTRGYETLLCSSCAGVSAGGPNIISFR